MSSCPHDGLFTSQALGDAAFDFKFEDSELLAGLMGEHTYETHPAMYNTTYT